MAEETLCAEVSFRGVAEATLPEEGVSGNSSAKSFLWPSSCDRI